MLHTYRGLLPKEHYIYLIISMGITYADDYKIKAKVRHCFYLCSLQHISKGFQTVSLNDAAKNRDRESETDSCRESHFAVALLDLGHELGTHPRIKYKNFPRFGCCFCFRALSVCAGGDSDSVAHFASSHKLWQRGRKIKPKKN